MIAGFQDSISSLMLKSVQVHADIMVNIVFFLSLFYANVLLGFSNSINTILQSGCGCTM
jgi:hypothetical protein